MSRRPGYLQRLTFRLATGLSEVPEPIRDRHARHIKGLQQADGGFAGRLGNSDSYYTSFGLRALAILGELQDEPAERARGFLQSRLRCHEKLIDNISLLFAATVLDAAAGLDAFAGTETAWKNALAEQLQQLRRDDGGYAKGPQGAASSTYFTFLAVICHELLGRPTEDADRIVAFVTSQRDTSGGFREIRASKRAGTNPTAAAVGILRMLDALDEPTRRNAANFLAGMQNEEGGLRANTRIPLADLLSTFTGLLTLADLDQLDALDTRRALRFVQALEQSSGGFLAAAWDESCDVEYAFYGLGSLALLAPVATDAS